MGIVEVEGFTAIDVAVSEYGPGRGSRLQGAAGIRSRAATSATSGSAVFGMIDFGLSKQHRRIK
jgi:hypothetical protein